MIRNVDGHDVDAVDTAIAAAHRVADRPTLICCKTIIGKGAPNKAGSADVHGAALGEKEVAATRAALGWAHAPFEIPAAIRARWSARERGAELSERMGCAVRGLPGRLPGTGQRVPAPHQRPTSGNLGRHGRRLHRRAGGQGRIRGHAQGVAAGHRGFAKALPELLGGSADLTGSVFTNWSGSTPVTRAANGNYIHFGVREFGMSAIANGVALHGGLIPYTGTFLTFSDYARNAVRMSALMKLRNIYVYTHDSIGLGEDGPTHQSVEHAASLRLIPNLDVWRPCDSVETAVAWAAAIERGDGPTALLFTRQNVPFQRRDAGQIAAIRAGGYVLADWAIATGKRAVIIATGSEVALAMSARDTLARKASRYASCRCRARAHSTARTLATERACCRPACPASRSRPVRPMAGASTSARPTTRGPRSSVSIRSANRRPPACCSSTSASRQRPSRQRYGAWWRDHPPFG